MPAQATKNTTLPTPVTAAPLHALDGIAHGFFGRKGGVSSGIYTSLNCGYGSNDEEKNVAANRDLAVRALGLKGEENLCTLFQIHSDIVVPMTKGLGAERPYEADAMVTATPNVALGILTADCTPVLFVDPIHRVIGAAHAGWKGAIGGVLDNTITAMEKLGAERGRIYTAIGPTIGQASYEVGPEFYDRFMEETHKNKRFFLPSAKAGHHMFDLPGYVAERLTNLGIAHITDVKKDTCALDSEYFSYRRTCLQGETKDYGRNLAVIALV